MCFGYKPGNHQVIGLKFTSNNFNTEYLKNFFNVCTLFSSLQESVPLYHLHFYTSEFVDPLNREQDDVGVWN